MNALVKPVADSPKAIAHFSKTSVLCLDREMEVTENFRAHYTFDPDGYVTIHKIERDETRAGKPPIWMEDYISKSEWDALVSDLEQTIREEQEQ